MVLGGNKITPLQNQDAQFFQGQRGVESIRFGLQARNPQQPFHK